MLQALQVSTITTLIGVGAVSIIFRIKFHCYYRDKLYLLNSDLSLDTSLDLPSSQTESDTCAMSTTTDNPVKCGHIIVLNAAIVVLLFTKLLHTCLTTLMHI